MVARYHHLAIRIAQFGHDLALTSRRATRRWENAQRNRSWGNLGMQIWGRKSWGECMREEPGMSERAREFLKHWVSDHVGAVADELRTAAGGNLIQCMLAALSAAAARTKQTVDLD
jgi:hypothetical protein